ncbi:MAG TPA: DinB family protein [Actinopolymorphaceae bacterium]
MPGMPGPVADEREALTAFLAQQRYVLRLTSYGLTDEQARLSPTVSTFSVGGLIKHVAQTERGWIDMIAQRSRPAGSGDGTDDYLAGFRLSQGETLADALAFYDEVAAATDAVLAGVTDLDQPVPVPHDVPWFPKDVTAWSVRWVLLHVIEETARHAGHADIVRESVDGGTAFPLMAAAEGWPSTPWMKPWTPDERPVAAV